MAIQPRQVALGSAAVVGIVLIALAVSTALERLISTPLPADAETVTLPDPSPTGVGHITATLFYGTPDGQALTSVRREVPLAEGRVEQGRQILMMALTPPPSGYLSPIPRGTTLRAFYITSQGDAFVDLSPQVSTAHPGGSFAELLTVSAIVNDVTANLPAVRRVQILIDGQQADTLAGHIDLRRPFTRDTSLVRTGR